MQFVMNKCFLLNSEQKFGADPSKQKPLNSDTLHSEKNDVTELKARLLNQLN